MPITPALAGGTDFAFGGATSATTAVHTAGIGDLPYQIAAFQALNPTPAQNEAQAVLALAASGAKHLLVLNLPNLGETPAIGLSGNPQLIALATGASALFDSLLATSLAQIAQTTGLRIDLLDTSALLNMAIQDPTAYGFTDATTPCWTGAPEGGSGTLCSTDRAVQNLYIFWDSPHPTEAGHALVARAALALVPEPGSVLLMIGGLAAVRGRSRATT